MKILKTGTLSGITTAAFGSGVSTPPIDISNLGGVQRTVGCWLSIEGDLGRTGSSLSVCWKGAPQKGGVTYTSFLRRDLSSVTGNMLVNSGTSKTGVLSDGSYLKSFTPIMPFIKLEAFASKEAGGYGAGVTNNISVRYAICAF